MGLAIYQYIYIYVTLLINVIGYPFNVYILVNENIDERVTKSYFIIQNIYSTIGITLIVTLLLYLKFKKQASHKMIYGYNTETSQNIKYNYFFILICIYNIVCIITSFYYIYEINDKYMYPLDIFKSQNIIDRYLLSVVSYNYLWALVNFFIYTYSLYCRKHLY